MLRLEVVIFAALFAGVYSQVVSVGDCPQVKVVTDFDASRYVGTWHEYQRYPVIWQIFGKCVTAEYTANDDNTIGVRNVQINSIFGNRQTISGTASFDGPLSEAKLTVVFPGVLGGETQGSYWVLGTDYDNYAVVYSCKQLGQLQFTTSWILTREATPSAEVVNQANEVVSRNNLNPAYYLRTDQVNCPAA